jgi:hypothetical protein
VLLDRRAALATSSVRRRSVRIGRFGWLRWILVIVTYRPDEVLDEAVPGVLLQVGGQLCFVGTGGLQLDRELHPS